MTHSYNYFQIYFFFFYKLAWERESKIMLTFGYYFRIWRSEQFNEKTSTAKSNDFKSLFGNEKHSDPYQFLRSIVKLRRYAKRWAFWGSQKQHYTFQSLFSTKTLHFGNEYWRDRKYLLEEASTVVSIVMVTRKPRFLPRCMWCRRGLAIRILSVRPFVRLSVTRVNCEKTVERSVQIYIPYER